MKKVCDIDINDAKKILSKLDQEKRNNAMFKALTKGGEALVDETKRQLIKDLPKANEGKKYGTPMSRGVKMKKDKYDNEILVHILGDFRLKFFELGTKERYTKKKVSYKRNGKWKFRKENDTVKGFKGKIKALKFFEQALRKENEIIKEIDNNLINEINKLLK